MLLYKIPYCMAYFFTNARTDSYLHTKQYLKYLLKLIFCQRPCQTPMMEQFLERGPNTDVWQGPEYATK